MRYLLDFAYTLPLGLRICATAWTSHIRYPLDYAYALPLGLGICATSWTSHMLVSPASPRLAQPEGLGGKTPLKVREGGARNGVASEDEAAWWHEVTTAGMIR